MSKQSDGGPAFPVSVNHVRGGMSLRDYFAAKAFERLVEAHINQTVDDLSKEDIANEAYSYADYMIQRKLSELSKGEVKG